MAVSSDRPAPYTSPKAVLDIIERYRNRGFPSPIDAEVLSRSGVVPDSLIPRTLQALQTLDLIDDQGSPTDTLENLRRVPEPEYKIALANWLKAAYADVFNFVDPATDDATRIRDAFRSYNPVGQQERMVTLFVGLCIVAGLMPEKEPQRRASDAPPSRRRTPRSSVAKNRRGTSAQQEPNGKTDRIPAPLAGLLATLPPPDTGWTTAKRNRFVTAFESVLDFCVPIIDANNADEPPEDGGQED